MEKDIFFKLIKDAKPFKKGRIFDCHGGLCRGIITSYGQSINFDDKEYFEVYHKKEKVLKDILKFTMYLEKDVITIQEADYVEDGMIIEIIDNKITLYEIPYGGGEKVRVGEYESIQKAISVYSQLT